MIARTAAVLALAGSAAAFSPMMSMDTGRRAVVQAGAAAAIAAPLLRPSPAEAGLSSLSTPGPVGAKSGGGGGGGGGGGKMPGTAPVITIFDHRGCQRGGPNKEYTGRKANGQDDEMCVKVQSLKIPISEGRAAAQLAESISFKAKGVDGEYTSNLGRTRPNY